MDLLDKIADEEKEQLLRTKNPATSGEDVFGLVADEELKQQQDSLRASVMMAVEQDPAKAAQIDRASRQSGIPKSLIELNLGEITKKNRERELYEASLRSPSLAAQMRNPEFAVLAQNDTDALGSIANTFSAASVGFTQGLDKQRMMFLSYKEVVGTLTSSEQAELNKLEKNVAETGMQYTEGLPSWFKAAADVVGMNLYSVADAAKTEGAIGLAGGAATGAALGLIGGPGAPITSTAGGAALGTKGFIAGASAGYFNNVYESSVGEAYQDLKQYKAPDGTKIDPVVARYAALIVGVPNTALEAFSLGKALKLIPGADKVIGKLTGDQLKKILVKPTMREALKDIGKKYAVAVGTETFTEGAQKFFNIIAREVAQEASVGEFPAYDQAQLDKDIGDIQAESTESFKASVVLGGIGGGVRAYQAKQQVAKAEEAQKVFEALGNDATRSELLKASPEQFKQFVSEATKDGAVQNVFIDAGSFQRFFQSVGQNPAMVAKEIGVKNYEEAFVAGTDVVIPIADFAQKVAPTEYLNGLMQDLRLAQGDLSLREARELQANTDKQDQDILQRAAEIQNEIQAPELQTIKGDMIQQLVASGYDATTADAYASVYAKTMSNLAERSGLTATDLHNKYGLTVSRPLPDVLAKNKQADISIDPLIERLRTGDVPTQQEIYGKSLVEFVREQGGILPSGELLDADKGNRPFQRNLLQPKGLDPDIAAQRAVEAGYFPDIDADIINENDLYEALDAELSGGQARFSIQQADQQLDALRNQLESLAEYIDQLGIDLTQVTDNAEVRRLIDEASKNPDIQDVVDRLFQAANAQYDTRTLYQAETEKRGFIQFGKERKFNITLLEKSDLSTFLHETGHFYLEVLGDLADMAESNQQIKDDYKTILNYLGLESRDQLSLDGKKPGSKEYKRAVDAHEKFARSNEAYLMEGKAPSLELRRIFQRFKQWLKLIYKDITGLNVELSDEVREVFDRIYATDEEIDAAKNEVAVDPLFMDAKTAGMTDAEFDAYKQSVSQTVESGKDALLTKLMREAQREKKAWWRAERDNVRQEVAAEVDAEPVYIAFKQLTDGDIKLDKDEIVTKYGEGYLKKLPRTFKRVYTTEGGMPLDAAARLLNYPSGDSLIEALASMRNRREYINAEADRIMRERHGDLMTDGTIADEAKDALHNTHREKVILAELRALNKELTGTILAPAKSFSDTAKGIVGQTAIRDLNPYKYLIAQRRAAKAAFDAMAENDRMRAFQEKRKELLNHFLYLESRAAQERNDKYVAYIKRFETKATRERMGKAGYLEQIDAILDGYEFRRVTNRVIDRRSMLEAFVRRQEDLGNPVNIPLSVLTDARQVNYRMLSVDELSAIHESVRNIANLASLKNKLLKMAEKRTLDEVAGEAISQIKANTKGGKSKTLESALATRSLGRWAKGFMLFHVKFATMANQMDGWKDGGFFWNTIVRPLNDAANKEATARADATKRLNDIFKVYRDTNMDTKKFIPSLGQSMTLQGRLSVALNWGRAENRQRIIDGNGLTQQNVDDIFDTLDERDWTFVKNIWSYLDSFWPEIEAQYKRLYGVAPEKSASLPFMTKFGEMPGGYYPIKYDATKSAQAMAQTADDVLAEMKSGAYMRSQTKNGFTKEVLENLDRAVRLDFSTMYQHVNEVIHDLSLREYLMDFNKLMSHRTQGTTLKDTIIDGYGDQFYNEIAETIRDVAIGDINAKNGFEQAMAHLRSGVSIAGMGWSVWTGLMQPLGLFQSIQRVGAVWVAKGMMKWGGDMAKFQNSMNFIYEKSEFMKTRNLTQNREINEIRNTIKRQGKFPLAREAYGMIEDSYFQLIIQGQKLVDIPTWFGAYEKAKAYGKDDATAVALADQAVIDAQSGGALKDLARIQRGGPLLKIWTTFYSYFSATYNLMYRAIGRTDFKDPISIGRLAVDTLNVMIFPAIATTVLREVVNQAVGGDDKDDEELIEAYIREQVSYTFGTVVGLREFATFIDPRFSYNGPAGARFISEFLKLSTQVSQGEIDDALRKAVINTGGILLHFPSTQINKTIDGIIALENGDTESAAAILLGAPKD